MQEPKEKDGTVAASLRHARLVAEREALAAVIPADPGWEYHRAEGHVQNLEHRLEALDEGDGWGVLRGTPVGEAAIAWKQAQGEQRRCLARAEHAGLRERHHLGADADPLRAGQSLGLGDGPRPPGPRRHRRPATGAVPAEPRTPSRRPGAERTIELDRGFGLEL